MTEDGATKNTPRGRIIRIRIVWPIIKAAGLARWSIVFAALYIAGSGIVALFEPNIHGFGNAAWLMFQVVTTIGLGDFTCVSIAGRIAVVVLSLYSVFFLALVTGAVVSYCSERMNLRRDASIAHFLDQLENLPELSPGELAELSSKVKKLTNRL